MQCSIEDRTGAAAAAGPPAPRLAAAATRILSVRVPAVAGIVVELGPVLGAEATVDGVEPLAVIIGAGMLLAYGIGDVFIVEKYG